MTYVQQLADGPTEFDRVWGLRPQFHELFMADYLASIERLDPVLIELCRLRMADLLCSRLDLSLRFIPAIAAGLAEEKITALPRYPTSELFDERERLCIEFAELFVIQSSNLGDDEVARVMTVLEPEEFIYFVKALSVMDQLQRTCTAFAIGVGGVPRTMAGRFQAVAGGIQ